MAGSLYAGACVTRYRSKHVLALMYASRALLIGLYLLMPLPLPENWLLARAISTGYAASPSRLTIPICCLSPFIPGVVPVYCRFLLPLFLVCGAGMTAMLGLASAA